MRRLNRKLLLILAIPVLVAGALLGSLLILGRSGEPDVGPMLAEAKEAAESGNIEEAVARYEQVLKVAPECDAAHLALGEIDEEAGRDEAALRHYGQAARLNPRNEATLTRLGTLCERLGLVEALGTTADRLLILDLSDRERAQAHHW